MSDIQMFFQIRRKEKEKNDVMKDRERYDKKIADLVAAKKKVDGLLRTEQVLLIKHINGKISD